MPFDYDESYAISSHNWDDYPIYKWGEISFPYPPLTYRILNVPSFKQDFTNYFWLFLQKVYNPNSALLNRLELYSELLSYEVMKDQYFTLDYARTYLDFLQETENLKTFINRRYSSAFSQLLPQSTTTGSSSSNTPGNNDRDTIIIASTIGGVVLIVIVSVSIFFIRRKLKQNYQALEK